MQNLAALHLPSIFDFTRSVTTRAFPSRFKRLSGWRLAGSAIVDEGKTSE